MNSPYDKNTIIMIRQSNASILVHNKAINVILQTSNETTLQYVMPLYYKYLDTDIHVT